MRPGSARMMTTSSTSVKTEISHGELEILSEGGSVTRRIATTTIASAIGHRGSARRSGGFGPLMERGGSVVSTISEVAYPESARYRSFLWVVSCENGIRVRDLHTAMSIGVRDRLGVKTI